MTRRILELTLGVVALAVLASAPPAVADGLPVPGVITPKGGVQGADGTHYVTRTRDRVTTVRELGIDDSVLQTTTVAGKFTVPAVAVDGSPSGLSADGSTLVLIRPRTSFPQPETHLLILDTDGLGIRDHLTLKGDFSYDAISPDASRIYFIQYLSPNDPTRYAVRAYDTAADRLLAEPIVDPKDEDPDEMRGYPLTRAVSPDGRWAYTLYDGGGKHPFIHALDTTAGKAVCVDTPSLAHRRDLYELSLSVGGDGSSLTVADGTRPVAIVDTQTFDVRGPSEPAPTSSDGGGGDPWWRLIAPTALLLTLAGGALFLILRRRSGALAAGDA